MVVPALALLTASVARTPLLRGARVVVAVSGGPDSTALLLACIEVASDPNHGWILHVGHVNHGMRDTEADRDEIFVRELATRNNLSLSVRHEDATGYARLHRLSREEAARNVRFGALNGIANEWGAEAVLVGHTADDQAETVLLRLARGSGMTGLGAMKIKSGRVIRPFLDVRRQTILDALVERNQEFRIDSSNSDLSLHRNYVRTVVLPALTKIQPQVVPVLTRTARLAQLDSDFLGKESQEAITACTLHESETAISGSSAVFTALHPAMQRGAVRLMVHKLLGHSKDFHTAHVEAVIEAIASRPSVIQALQQFPHGIGLVISERHFMVCRQDAGLVDIESNAAYSRLAWEVKSGGQVYVQSLPGLSRNAAQHLIAVCGRICVLVDADKLGTGVSLRVRRPGDRMRPLGLGGSKKLQDIMTDRRVCERARNLWPVIESGSGIVWLPGLCLDESISISSESTNFSLLKFVPCPNNPVLNYGSIFFV